MSLTLVGIALKADVPTAVARAILIKLADCCDEDGKRIFPSFATLAKIGKCSRKTAKRYVQLFCAVGLLTKVRAGGFGPGSTNYYDLNVSVLTSLVERPWHEVAGDLTADSVNGDCLEDSDEGENRDSSCGVAIADGENSAVSYAQTKGVTMTPLDKKGDTMTPLAEIRGTNDANKGDTPDPQPLNRNPQESERERAEASERGSQPSNLGVHADGARLPGDGEPSPDGVAVPQLAEFVKAWPTSLADNRDLTAGAWGELTIAERRAALAEIGRFVDGCRRIGRTKIISGSSYLRGRKWLELPALQREVASGEIVSVRPFSKSWWALWHHAKAGRGGNARLLLQWADQGKEWFVRQGDVDAARPDTLKAFPAHGEAASAFLASASRAGFRFPKFSESAWLFLPEQSDAAVDDLKQAGGL